MHPSDLNRYGCHGILLFLSLVAWAMVAMSPLFIILPLLALVVIAYLLPPRKHAAAYLAVALTVCKNE